MRLLVINVILLLVRNSYEKFEPFVVGGTKSNILKVPHSVYLVAHCQTEWICGSSVLNQKILLTAGHCISNCHFVNGDSFDAFAGHENIRKSKIKRQVDGWKLHEHYDEQELHNDIALLILDYNLPLGGNVKRVIIAKQFPKLREGLVAGWGAVNEITGVTSIHLKQTKVLLRSPKYCKRLGYIPKSVFCAGSTNAKEDHPSRGDSGSAIIAKDGVTQLGLVSFRLAEYQALLVYTNVTYYMKWIKKGTKRLYCEQKRRKEKTGL